ncbi:hypothetical protein [Caballeronia grimmiae]|uniref:hypothetical protein n=1 Tax=Caballeronia grimmiae TaxID=1071679 RepID=UPI0038B6DA87
MKYAFEAAKEHNDGLAFRALSSDMRLRGVYPSRGAIFNDAMLNRHGGEKLTAKEIDLYTGLLEKLPRRMMRKEGVKRAGAVYTSPEYQESYEQEIAKALGRESKLPPLALMKDPDDPTILFWRRGPGDIVKLECSVTDRARWNRLLAEDVDFDVAIDDRKTRIRDARYRTFNKPLPDFIVDSLIKQRRTVYRRAAELGAEVGAVARGKERERERRELFEASRKLSEQVHNAEGEPESQRVTEPNMKTDNCSPPDTNFEVEVLEARRARNEKARALMQKFLHKNS